MELIKHIDKIEKPYKNAVITIGNFDGVHIGHQALFHEVIEKADAIDGTSIVMTFEPHPVRVLKQNGHLPLITLYEQKIELIENSGIDVLICIPFTEEFAAISAKTFVQDILLKSIGMKAIVVGEDYTFGRNREGDIDLLQAYAKDLGFEVVVADWIQTSKNGPGRISSTRTRELVEEGRVDEAQKLLGRYYQLRGIVTTGRNRGGNFLDAPQQILIFTTNFAQKTVFTRLPWTVWEGFFKVLPISAIVPLLTITFFQWKSISLTLMKTYTARIFG